MTPKEKANELFDKYDKMDFHDCSDHKKSAKDCAIIAVDEVIDSYEMANVEYEDGYFLKYWQEIKEEIEKL